MSKPIDLYEQEINQLLREGRALIVRPMKEPPANDGTWRFAGHTYEMYMGYPMGHDVPTSPYGNSWDITWGRETYHIDWYPDDARDAKGKRGAVHYRADDNFITHSWNGEWCSPVTMPRWASRFGVLVIKDARVLRTQYLFEEDARLTGSPHDPNGNHKPVFALWWDIHFKKKGYPYKENPFVWVFEVITKQATAATEEG